MLVACVSAIGALSVAGVSAAAAAPAAFNIPANSALAVPITGTLTVTDGTVTTTCTFSSDMSWVSNSAAMEGSFSAHDSFASPADCANGRTLSLTVTMPASKNAGAFSLTNTMTGAGASAKNPVGASPTYTSSVFTVPFLNGSGSTPSKIVFNKTVLGVKIWGGTISATGFLSIYKANMGLITLG